MSETEDEREAQAAEVWDASSYLVQSMAIGWKCGHDFAGGACPACFGNMEHAAMVATRIFAAMVAEAKAEALRDAAEVCASSPSTEWRYAGDMLRARAERIAREGGQQ